MASALTMMPPRDKTDGNKRLPPIGRNVQIQPPRLTSESGEPITIFITGITGYIGGTVADYLISSHPELNIAALVRNENHVSSIRAMFPNVRIVRGSLDDRDVLIEECSKAKLVLPNWCGATEMAMDHEEGLLSIIEGIRRSNEKGYGYLIHTSNISTLVDHDFELGEFDDMLGDDVADLNTIKAKLSKNPRGSEIMIMNAAAQNTENYRPVRSAIVCPSAVYGFGRGPIRKRGGKLTDLMRAIILHKSAFEVGRGRNFWSLIDIDNLAKAYLFLVEKALGPIGVGPGYWDSRGFYVVETEEVCWGLFARGVGDRVQQRFFVDEPSIVKKLTANEVDSIYAGGSTYWGTNVRLLGTRLRKLGWNPYRGDLVEYVDKRLGFEIQELYGITIEEQELETDERRPEASLDNPSVLQANSGNVMDENADAVSTDEEVSMQLRREAAADTREPTAEAREQTAETREETKETGEEAEENEGGGKGEGQVTCRCEDK
ncbi:hypothetical protein VE04_09568, partial [Pseudogymnoascus sp. 24MN13]